MYMKCYETLESHWLSPKLLVRHGKLREMEILPECVLMGFTFITFTIFIVRWRIIFHVQMRINSSSSHALHHLFEGFICKLFRLQYIQLSYARLSRSLNNEDKTAHNCCDLNLIMRICMTIKVDGNKSLHLLKIHLQSNEITKTNYKFVNTCDPIVSVCTLDFTIHHCTCAPFKLATFATAWRWCAFKLSNKSTVCIVVSAITELIRLKWMRLSVEQSPARN